MAGLDRTFGAVLCGWEGILAPDERLQSRRLARIIEGLAASGIEIVIVASTDVEGVDRRLDARPAGPARLHVYDERHARVYVVDRDGVHPCEFTGSPHAETTTAATAWAAEYFSSIGIGPGIVLVGGISSMLPAGWERATVVRLRDEADGPATESPPNVIWLDGGAARFHALLEAQLARERHLRVPDIDDDPLWVIPVSGLSTLRRRVDESLLTLSNGRFGTRGSLEEDGPGTTPAVLAADIYTGSGAAEHLQECPIWTDLRVPPSTDARRLLDLRTGILVRLAANGFRSVRLVSAHRADTAALRVESTAPIAGSPLVAPSSGPGEAVRDGPVWMMRTTTSHRGGVAAAARQRRRTDGEVHTLERLATFVADADRAPSITAARHRLDDVRAIGFAQLLRRHRATWASRWRDIDIEIPDDPDLQRAVRFSLFHTISCAADDGEAAVGARGLSGIGYAGHVFWDADVFVLPTLTAIAPARARAMLEYRIRRLDAARAAAVALGRTGARFPWESARDGTDVTPRSAFANGVVTPILTGEQQEHIVADVAWAAWHYAGWTGDEEFLTGPGYPLLLDTARYWASRLRLDAAGHGHIDHVIGPDEYHVNIDDNAFTNVMARWNLRAAARLVQLRGTPTEQEEATAWCRLADALVDGYHPNTKLYEQFSGYFDREPVLASSIATPPFAADLLLGLDHLAKTQIIKQTDALMIHHLLPDDAAAGSLEPNLDFYAPRTSHGSSLSPAIQASLHARAGQFGEAMHWLRLASRLDLDDITGMTSGGLHMATMAGVWQAIAFGFLGLRWNGKALQVDPRLPPEWSELTLRCHVRGCRVVVRVTHDEAALNSDRPIPIADPDGSVVRTTSVVRPIR